MPDFSAPRQAIPAPSGLQGNKRSPAGGSSPVWGRRLSLSRQKKNSPGLFLRTSPASLHLETVQCSRFPPVYLLLLPGQFPAWSSGYSEIPEEILLQFFQFPPAVSGNAQIPDNPSGDGIPSVLAVTAVLSVCFDQFQNALRPFDGAVIMTHRTQFFRQLFRCFSGQMNRRRILSEKV